jgi:hypothetical protein
MTKKELREDPNSPWNKADDSELLFILRAQDQLAGPLVERWADQARYKCSREKIAKAYEIANAMKRWPNRKMPD